MPIDLKRTEENFATSTDLTVGIEEEFAILDPETLDLVPRFEELRARPRWSRGCRTRSRAS